jgi:hypothetical protein
MSFTEFILGQKEEVMTNEIHRIDNEADVTYCPYKICSMTNEMFEKKTENGSCSYYKLEYTIQHYQCICNFVLSFF